MQRFAAVWTPEQLAGHRRANVHLHRIVKEAFAWTGEALRAAREIDEFDVQQLHRRGLRGGQPDLGRGDPIVGVNANSADPHYMPDAERCAPIRKGDFLLIDLWAKETAPASVYADITWCGVCAAAPTDRQARDLGRRRPPPATPACAWCRIGIQSQPVRGFEVDDATRAVIDAAGYGEYFIHRTGHSIHVTDHGPGANMDNLETHDTRPLIAMTCFSIEPGIYFAGDFGVRTEINVVLRPDGGRGHRRRAAARAAAPAFVSEPPSPDPGAARRPLSSRNTAWAAALSRALVRWRIRPNAISLFSVAATAGSGAALIAAPRCPSAAGAATLYIAAAAGIQLRLLCNLMDGMVAVEGRMGGPLGELYNDLPDRFADAFVLVGAGYSLSDWPYGVELGWLVAGARDPHRLRAGARGRGGREALLPRPDGQAAPHGRDDRRLPARRGRAASRAGRSASCRRRWR